MTQDNPENKPAETLTERLLRIAAENKTKEATPEVTDIPAPAPKSTLIEPVKVATDKVEFAKKNAVGIPVQEVTPTPTAVTEVEEKTFHVFHCTILSCKMLTETGRTIAFVNGVFITDVEEELNYLKAQIALNHPRLRTEKGKEVMTASELDPMEVLRKKHIAEYLAGVAEHAAKLKAGTLDSSASEVEPLTPGSTSDTVKLAADSGL